MVHILTSYGILQKQLCNMKKYVILFLNLIILFQAKGQNDIKTFWESMKDTIVERHLIQLDNDLLPDTVLLRFPSNYDHSEFGYTDPGVFIILDIKTTNSNNILIEDVFDSLPKSPFLKFQNKISSNLIFHSDFGTNEKYIFLTGPSYGCCLEKTYIFSVSKKTINLISSSELRLVNVLDFDKDGQIEIIGYDSRGEGWGGYETEYEFNHLVYPKVFKIADTLTVDYDLTYKYNSDLKYKFGDFMAFKRPVIVKNMIDKSEILIEFENIDGNYYRKFGITSSTKMKKTAFDKYSKKELRIMRNEIFASHGYIFKSADLKELFSKTKWYKPQYKDVTDKLTKVEKYNIKLILENEKK